MSALPLTFAEFYPRYLREHQRRGTRVLHFVGTTLFFGAAGVALWRGQPRWLLWGVVAAYGFAWVGHFFVEHNRPATFQHPWFSLRGDFKLYFELLRGREKFYSAGPRSLRIRTCATLPNSVCEGPTTV